MNRRLLWGAWALGMVALARTVNTDSPEPCEAPAPAAADTPTKRPTYGVRLAAAPDTLHTPPPPHPLEGREQLNRAAGGVDLARSALASGDPVRLQLLLGYLEAGSAADLLSPEDLTALRMANTCLTDDSPEAREAAQQFLHEVRGSRLRKDVRRACFR